LDSELAELGQQHLSLRAEHEGMARWAQSLDQDLTDTRVQLFQQLEGNALLGSQLSDAWGHFARVSGELEIQNNRVLFYSKELTDLQETVAQLRAELARNESAKSAEQRYSAELRQALTDVLQSRSWKITAPLRKVLAKRQGT